MIRAYLSSAVLAAVVTATGVAAAIVLAAGDVVAALTPRGARGITNPDKETQR